MRLKILGRPLRMWHKLTPVLLLLFLTVPACTLFGSRSGSGEVVSFRTSDGFLLEGRLFGSGTKAVVLSHMFPADQSSWFDTAEDFAAGGYLVLTYNFRGYGESQGGKDINLLDRDVKAAISFLTEAKSVSDIALVGASMGGTASIGAAAGSEVDGVATLSAPVRFRGLDASSAITGVLARKLFLASLEDRDAAESAERLLKLSRDPEADIKFFPGDAHGTDMVRGRRGDEVRAALLSFLKEALS